MIEKFNWKNFDFSMFILLFLSITLYQLQLWSPWIAAAHFREILFAYCYIRLLFFYPIKLDKSSIFMLLYILGAFLVAVHTYFVGSAHLAIAAFLRFTNITLLAPLAFIFPITKVRTHKLLFFWSTVIVLGAACVAYQLSGGNMDWLVKGYLAIRGDLIRHKTILGEPNVGGMAAPLLYIIAFLLIKKPIVRYFVIWIAFYLVVVSVSKAALMMFILANLGLVTYVIWKRYFKKISIPRSLYFNLMAVILCAVAMSASPTLTLYRKYSFQSLTGIRGEPGAYDDFDNRFLSHRYGRESSEHLTVLRQFLFGESYSVAGSTAMEMKVPGAVGPHNGYLEIYLVGGATLLVLLLAMQLNAFIWLFKSAYAGSELHFAFLLIFGLLSLAMTGYPIMYEPITGSLFWVIIGLSYKKTEIDSWL